MKKILLVMLFSCLAGGCRKEDDGFRFDSALWVYGGISLDNYYIQLLSPRHDELGYARYYTLDRNGDLTAERSGSGDFEKVSDTKIIFTNFIVENRRGRDFIIDSATYPYSALHKLIISYRKDVNPQMYVPDDPFANPEPIWSEESEMATFYLVE